MGEGIEEGHAGSEGEERGCGIRRRAVAATWCLATPAGAQVTTVETVPPEVDEDGHTAGDRVNQIVVTLRVVAGLMLVASGVYWWQTRPDRVVRAAVARGELERATARVEADAAAALATEDTGSPEPVPEGVEPEPESERVSAESVPIRSRSSADVLTDAVTATGNGSGGPGS